MGVSWNDTVSITINLSTLTSTVAGFGGLLLVTSLAESTLAGFGTEVTVGNGSKYLPKISSVAEATDANTATAGSVGADLLEDLPGALAHPWASDSVSILAVDLAGSPADAYDTIFGVLESASPTDYYGVVPVSHTVSDIVDIAKGVAASGGRDRLVFGSIQAAAAYGLPATWDAAYVDGSAAAIAESVADNVVLTWHSSDAQPVAPAVSSRGLRPDPDTVSSPWQFAIPQINKTGLPSGVSGPALRAALEANNINVPGTFYTTDVWFEPGVTSTGKPIYLMQTAHWFKIRLESRLQRLKYVSGQQDLKIGLSRAGQLAVLEEIESLYQQGVSTGHFLSRQEALLQGFAVEVRALPISVEDRTLSRLRFVVSLPVLIAGRIYALTVNIIQ